MTLVKKSQRRTAPRSTGTKSKPDEATAFKYLVMKPQRTMSMVIQMNIGTMRVMLPGSGGTWRRTMAATRRRLTLIAIRA